MEKVEIYEFCEVGNIFVNHRIEEGLTQAEAAEKYNIPKSILSRIENNRFDKISFFRVMETAGFIGIKLRIWAVAHF